MRVYISADLEGISGVVHGDQVGPAGGSDFTRTRQLATEEVNAAISAAFDFGASRVIVNDGHGTMRNLLIESLVPQAQLITGSPKLMGQMEGIDATPPFDAALFIGYHSRAGTPGVLNHTISGAVVAGVTINEIEVGEVGLNAAIAGHFGVPVALVSGDSALCQQIQSVLPATVGVAVKETIGRQAALCLSPEHARAAIYEGTQVALERIQRGTIPLFDPGTPVHFRLRVFNTAMADVAALLPGARTVGPLELAYEAPDAPAAYRALRAMIFLSASVR